MKILAEIKNDRYSPETRYICEISDIEIANIFNNWNADYLKKDKNITIECGKEIDIAAGYNFLKEINEVCGKFKNAYDAFVRASGILEKFVGLTLKNGGETSQ